MVMSSKAKLVVGGLVTGGVALLMLPKKAHAAASSPGPSPTAGGAGDSAARRKVQLAQAAMVKEMIAREVAAGSVQKAKGAKQPLATAEAFQRLAKLKPDGRPGPETLKAAARVGPGGELPHVWYWPKGATTTDVKQYRDDLEAIAAALEKSGATARAADLRESARGEHGEGGVAATPGAPRVVPTPAGPAVVRPSAVPSGAPSATPTAATSVAKALSKAALLAVPDPQPSWPTLGVPTKGKKYTSSGSKVKAWQTTLLGFGYPLPKYGADSDFGKETKAATLMLQKGANALYQRFGIAPIDTDGVVGKDTRTAAARMKLAGVGLA